MLIFRPLCYSMKRPFVVYGDEMIRPCLSVKFSFFDPFQNKRVLHCREDKEEHKIIIIIITANLSCVICNREMLRRFENFKVYLHRTMAGW